MLCQTSDDWVANALRLKGLIRVLDPYGGRPVSANQNGWVGPNTPLDLQGFDYSTSNYDNWHAQAPWIPSISSETSSAVSDRGEYVNNATSGHVSGYDNNYPGWGESAEQAWGGVGENNGQGILTRPFIAGVSGSRGGRGARRAGKARRVAAHGRTISHTHAASSSPPLPLPLPPLSPGLDVDVLRL